MDNSKNILTLIGVGIGIGVVLTVIVIVVLDARPSGVNLGPVEFDIPIATTALQPTSTVQQVAQQPTNTNITPKGSTQTEPTSVPVLPTATQAPLVTTYQVFANLSWQDTGIEIKRGDRLRIIWDGTSRWRGTNSGDFSDPLGGYTDTSNPQYACAPLMPPEAAGWNALVAKIGDNGTPTNPFKEIPIGDGTLRLAMNDCDSQRYDNEGSVAVTIEVSR